MTFNPAAVVGEKARPTRDLDTRPQIHDLVVRFYREIVFDDLLGPVFDEVAEVDWSTHIPKLIDYWLSSPARPTRLRRLHPACPPGSA